MVINTNGRTEYAYVHNPYVAENEAFVHTLRTGDASRILSDYAYGFKTQFVACAAMESAEKGLSVLGQGALQ